MSTPRPDRPHKIGTRASMWQRRAAIANAVRNGWSFETIAAEFKVSISTITNSCKEHGIRSQIKKGALQWKTTTQLLPNATDASPSLRVRCEPPST